MTAQSYRRIVNISSVNGQIGAMGQADDGASKGGIIASTRTSGADQEPVRVVDASGRGKYRAPTRALRRRGRPRVSTFAVLTKYQELVVNFGWESTAAPTSVDQEVVQVKPQPNVVLPQTGKGIRNSRKPLK